MALTIEKDKVDFGLIAGDQAILKRCTEICQDFGYSFKHWQNLDEFMTNPEECRLMVTSACGVDAKTSNSETAQVIRLHFKDAFIVGIVEVTISKETAVFARKSGTDILLLLKEAYETSKLEYAASQVIKAHYLPIKVSDLAIDKPVPFPVYHLMPQRKKFIKLPLMGEPLSEERHKKLSEVGELYIQKHSAEEFYKYVSETPNRSSAGLAKRCRSQYLYLCTSYTNLVLALTNQAENVSYKEGQEYLKKIMDLADELITTLGEFSDAWEIVNNSTIGEFGSVERAPAVAVYAALFGLQIGAEKINEMMISALLSFLGLLFLPSSITKKIREDRLSELTQDEAALYEKHPFQTLDIILNRKLSVDVRLREIILSINERADGKGFPRKLSGIKVTPPSQLIQFSNLFDRKTVIKIGKPRIDHSKALSELVDALSQEMGRFSPLLLNSLRGAFL